MQQFQLKIKTSEEASDTSFGSNLKRNISDKLISQLRSGLDSSYDAEKIEALKKIIELTSKGKNLSSLFADVVKQVSMKSVEGKKLAYMFITKYYNENKDIALLSVNTFYKDIDDANEYVRALSLRTLTNLLIPEILPVLLISVRKGVSDKHPFVRRVAAHSLLKLHELDKSLDLSELVETLLNDLSVQVIGAACLAFLRILPHRFDLLHKNFRKLCRMLTECDEWSQIIMLQVLFQYSVALFDIKSEIDEDLNLFLHSSSALLHSTNAAVVVEVVNVYYFLTPKKEWKIFVRPLLRLIKTRKETEYLALKIILKIVLEVSEYFQGFAHLFFYHPKDPVYVRELKFEILSLIFSSHNSDLILGELEVYLKSPSGALVQAAIKTLGNCFKNQANLCGDAVIRSLMILSKSAEKTIIEECFNAIINVFLVNRNVRILNHLAISVSKISNTKVKLKLYWILGNHCNLIPNMAPDLLRLAVKSFENEEESIQLQILIFSLRVFSCYYTDKRVKIIFLFLLKKGLPNTNYRVQEKSRFIWSLLMENKISYQSFVGSENFDLEIVTEVTSDVFKKLLFRYDLKQERSRPGRTLCLSTLSSIVGYPFNGALPMPKLVGQEELISAAKLRSQNIVTAQYNPWTSPKQTVPLYNEIVNTIPSLSLRDKILDKEELEKFLNDETNF